MPNKTPPTVELFGLHINKTTFEESVDLLCEQVTLRPAKVVVTPNVDHVVSLNDNPELHALYSSADFTFADGMPLVWASRLMGDRLPERVTGADLFVALCQRSEERNWRVAVVGGKPGQEAKLAARFALVYPNLKVSIYSPPMGFDYRNAAAQATIDWVNSVHADIVFVCLGFPRQCLWSLNGRNQFDAGLVLCVGAAMEFALGLKKRAPIWMQRAGLEWLSRLNADPVTLWRRYLVRDTKFFPLVWRMWRNKGKKTAGSD
jgi:N-acetylglucosaminyldiphosphoundecaprenol N-acetyl-beta-D-mannosaminyltransferase